jgi:hypothetical protein
MAGPSRSATAPARHNSGAGKHKADRKKQSPYSIGHGLFQATEFIRYLHASIRSYLPNHNGENQGPIHLFQQDSKSSKKRQQ